MRQEALVVFVLGRLVIANEPSPISQQCHDILASRLPVDDALRVQWLRGGGTAERRR